jgi:hypothetical protein
MCEKKNHKLSIYLGANVDFVLLLRRVPSDKKGIGSGLLEQVQLHPPRLSNPLPKHHGVIKKSQIIRGFVIFASNFCENSKTISTKMFANEVFARLTLGLPPVPGPAGWVRDCGGQDRAD